MRSLHRGHRHLAALLLTAILLPGMSIARAQDRPAKQPGQPPHTLDEYFALGERGRKGEVAGAVAEIRTWNWRAFRDLWDALEKLRSQLEPPSQRIRERWGRADIEALAMLHTEAAIRCRPFSTEEASHANWAKQLLELFEGLSVDQAFRRRWHVAWGAHLQSALRLRELADHLHNALRKWPDDPDLLAMAGSMYESWSHRAVSRLQGERPERRKSRGLAEHYYRRALELQPGLFDARLRLGRTVAEANRLDEALAHITTAAERAASPREQYVTRLFLGRVYAAAQRWSEAIAAYTAADGLLADCQLSAIALSYAFLKQGAKEKARAQVKVALERSSPELCQDPWWEYEFGYGPRADALLDELRERLRP